MAGAASWTALANLAKRIDHAEKTAEEAATEKEIDAEARELVQLQLDDEEEPQDEATLEAAVNNASRATRFEVFKEARSFRTKNWEKPESMLRVIPIFRALIDNAAGQVFHRNHAQLSRAIALRDRKGTELVRSDGSPAFLMYEFNRAICAIELGLDDKAILADLTVARRRESLRKLIEKDTVFTGWAKAHGVDLETLRMSEPSASSPL